MQEYVRCFHRKYDSGSRLPMHVSKLTGTCTEQPSDEVNIVSGADGLSSRSRSDDRGARSQHCIRCHKKYYQLRAAVGEKVLPLELIIFLLNNLRSSLVLTMRMLCSRRSCCCLLLLLLVLSILGRDCAGRVHGGPDAAAASKEEQGRTAADVDRRQSSIASSSDADADCGIPDDDDDDDKPRQRRRRRRRHLQEEAVLWQQMDPTLAVQSQDQRHQRLALVSLYYATNGDQWDDNTAWLSYEVNECEWFSRAPPDQVCNDGGWYRTLDLRDNGLVGTIAEELGFLSVLEIMDLSRNNLYGTLPSEIAALSNLVYLNVGRNDLTGSLPAGLVQLMSLSDLSLEENEFTGTIPNGVNSLQNLSSWTAGSNDLNGTIPSTIGRLTNLEHLDLSHNALTGTIPPTMTNLLQLQFLSLAHNRLTGPIPSGGESPLVNLESLYLEGNLLTGTIPDAGVGLIGLSSLQVLSVANNSLTGSIPNTTLPNNATNIIQLMLSSNQLNGTIPPTIGRLTNLEHLDLGHNVLSGEIPSSWTALRSLVNLTLDNNTLTGTIPMGTEDNSSLLVLGDNTSMSLEDENEDDALLNGSSLWMHNVSNNSLTGTMVSCSIHQLSNLASLSARSNRLSGSLAPELVTLPRLSNLNIEQNGRISGAIPSEIGLSRTLEYFVANENRIASSVSQVGCWKSYAIVAFGTCLSDLNYNKYFPLFLDSN
jgi:Leucine-rich repeat (LRR) protein